jgi:hypothetical protein
MPALRKGGERVRRTAVGGGVTVVAGTVLPTHSNNKIVKKTSRTVTDKKKTLV